MRNLKKIEEDMISLFSKIKELDKTMKINKEELRVLKYYYKINLDNLYFISIIVNNKENAFVEDFDSELSFIEKYILDTKELVNNVS
ncbi:MAG: hypothetical protein CL760_06235 [Chloroflexi bacterium]|nr:hypothetical protein [Chloroflexota bacterium]|tara:strand:+ start:42524 stop:42784 length:261 start_codon:yes stop_codon:yes gene_type:complete